jgi:uncharacterized membrane protein YdjX (TVP38/TMEM64 family)
MMRPKLLAFLAMTAVLSLAASLLAGHHLAALIMARAAALRDAGLAGPALFAFVFFLSVLAGIIPGGLLGLAAGAIFGLGAGFATAATGSLTGAAAAFALSRSYLRPAITALLTRYGALARLDRVLRGDGWRLVALLRVSPVIPFSLTSYALGLSCIGWRDYLLGSLASLPTLFGYAVLGALGSYGARLQGGSGHAIHLALLSLGGAATLALIWHSSRLLGRALKPA